MADSTISDSSLENISESEIEAIEEIDGKNDDIYNDIYNETFEEAGKWESVEIPTRLEQSKSEEFEETAKNALLLKGLDLVEGVKPLVGQIKNGSIQMADLNNLDLKNVLARIVVLNQTQKSKANPKGIEIPKDDIFFNSSGLEEEAIEVEDVENTQVEDNVENNEVDVVEEVDNENFIDSEQIEDTVENDQVENSVENEEVKIDVEEKDNSMFENPFEDFEEVPIEENIDEISIDDNAENVEEYGIEASVEESTYQQNSNNLYVSNSDYQNAISVVNSYQYDLSSRLDDQVKRRIIEDMDILISKGYSIQAAAGIIGNGWQESGLDPDDVNSSGYTGVFQFDPKLRLVNYKAYLKNNGLSFENNNSFKHQLEYIEQENNCLNSRSGMGLENFKSLTSAYDACYTFYTQVEFWNYYDSGQVGSRFKMAEYAES